MRIWMKWAKVSLLLLVLAFTASAAAGGPDQSTLRPGKARDSANYQAWLVKKVRHELLMLPYYSVFDNLEFRAEGDRVTLLGQVVRPTLKSDAEAAVKKIEGVAGVDNRIEVLPMSPFDDRLRRALFRAIYSDGALNRYVHQPVPAIHIIVNRGHATLEGVVSNEADRNIAYIRASGVPGVFSVTNRLRVEG